MAVFLLGQIVSGFGETLVKEMTNITFITNNVIRD
jgi:hypothetical protein